MAMCNEARRRSRRAKGRAAVMERSTMKRMYRIDICLKNIAEGSKLDLALRALAIKYGKIIQKKADKLKALHGE
jgi:hypothetical protein